uniref:Uncharacterized protein n=1 Tax=Leersia perrieri TaxID=77586 RepID=A0A0D9WFK6_9ORYZ
MARPGPSLSGRHTRCTPGSSARHCTLPLGLKSTVSCTAARSPSPPSSSATASTARESPTLARTRRSPCLTRESAVHPLWTASRRRLARSSPSTAAQAARYDCLHRSSWHSPSLFSPPSISAAASVTASRRRSSSAAGSDSLTAFAT